MGNGLGIVNVFLKKGAKVIILDFSDKLEETLSSLQGNVTGYNVNIRDMDRVKECIEKVYMKYGQIDVLVNNAGVCRLETF